MQIPLPPFSLTIDREERIYSAVSSMRGVPMLARPQLVGRDWIFWTLAPLPVGVLQVQGPVPVQLGEIRNQFHEEFTPRNIILTAPPRRHARYFFDRGLPTRLGTL